MYASLTISMGGSGRAEAKSRGRRGMMDRLSRDQLQFRLSRQTRQLLLSPLHPLALSTSSLGTRLATKNVLHHGRDIRRSEAQERGDVEGRAMAADEERVAAPCCKGRGDGASAGLGDASGGAISSR
jgi:hypothetical protein